ncbi:MAG TPA: TIGR03435 family protein [Terracidiphilus sp.]|nr:TIGR03435 family protein [Terracidiphilus sp.]
MLSRFLRMGLIGAVLPGVTAHSQAAHGAFEVASIRPAAAQHESYEGSSRSQIEPAADGLTMHNIDLGEMVEWAYELEHFQLQGPSMLQEPRYDVRARAAGPVEVGVLRLMLRDLLATRFGVQLHKATKRAEVYELVVAKEGARLPEDKTKTLPPVYPKESLPRVVDGGFVFRNVTLSDFAKQLSELRGIDYPVLDRTGIAGVYDITLKSAARAMLEPDGPSLLTLIHEQLGLKLVSAKDLIDVVVVDHAEAPSAN